MCTHASRLHTCPTYIRPLITMPIAVYSSLTVYRRPTPRSHRTICIACRWDDALFLAHATRIKFTPHRTYESAVTLKHHIHALSLPGIRLLRYFTKHIHAKLYLRRVIYRDRPNWLMLIGSTVINFNSQNETDRRKLNKIKKRLLSKTLHNYFWNEVILSKIKLLYFYIFNIIPTLTLYRVFQK